MARRSSTTQKAAENDTKAAEAPVEEPTTTDSTATESTEEKPVDLEPFKKAATDAVATADESTGDLSKEAIDSVNKVYREIEGVKGKNQARGYIEDQMKLAISEEKNIVKARAYVTLKDGLSAGSGGGTTRTPADPTTAYVQKVASLLLAQTLVTETVPEGVAEDWAEKVDQTVSESAEQVEAYKAFLASEDEDAEAPEVGPVVRQAFKVAQGKGTGGSGRVSGGPRRDVEKHMAQVFENLESGSFLTINEIAKATSSEYGDDRPSAGAVSARLFPKGRDAYKSDTLVAVAEEGKPRGARKV